MSVSFMPGLPDRGQTVYGERPGRIEYLYLTEKQKHAGQALDDAIDDLPPFTRLRCQIPEIKELHGKTVEYYPHMDYDERVPPTEAEADLMCRTNGEDCPVRAQCKRMGMALHAPTGVWGHRVLVDGKDYYKRNETVND